MKSPRLIRDIVTCPVTGKYSCTKIGQVLGMVVSTWIVIKLTLNSSLSGEIFLTYLAYIAAADGFSKFLRTKSLPSQQRDVIASTSYGDVVTGDRIINREGPQ